MAKEKEKPRVVQMRAIVEDDQIVTRSGPSEDQVRGDGFLTISIAAGTSRGLLQATLEAALEAIKREGVWERLQHDAVTWFVPERFAQAYDLPTEQSAEVHRLKQAKEMLAAFEAEHGRPAQTTEELAAWMASLRRPRPVK